MTARYADRVALMSSDGRIAETGDPRQLMEDQGSRLSSLINKVSDPTQPCFCGFEFWHEPPTGAPVTACALHRSGARSPMWGAHGRLLRACCWLRLLGLGYVIKQFRSLDDPSAPSRGRSTL